MKKIITQDERLQLIGLMTLARAASADFQKCEGAMGRMMDCLDTDGYAGQFSDAIFSTETIDTILKNNKVEIV